MMILGVRVDDVDMDSAVKTVEESIEKQKLPQHVVTTGPEFLVTAQKDNEFKEILNNSLLSVPDGSGLRLVCGVKNVVPGVDLMIELIKVAQTKGWSIGLLGGQNGVATKTKDILKKQFPRLKINFALDGAEADRIIGLVYSNEGVKDNNAKLDCDLLFVNLGHPKQEKFIYSVIPGLTRNPQTAGSRLNGRDDVVSFKVAMGVGGSFDFISGNLPRPPQIWREAGMGWFFRLVTEKPEKRWWRLKRILNATVVFPILYIFDRIKVNVR